MIFSVVLQQHHHGISGDVDRPEPLARRLKEVNHTNDTSNLVNHTNDTLNLTMIMPIPCFRNFIKPCGNVTLPEEGINITIPFGTYHIDGGGELQPEIEAMDHMFSKYTVYFCAAVVGAWAALTVIIPAKRKAMMKSVKLTLEGNLDAEPVPGEPEEVEDLDIKSEHFVAPGNIYRVLAVCPPGSPGVSFSRWLMWSSKAFLCAYMQVYLPCGFLTDIFSEWEFDSIKSPIWFAENAGSFLTMFASLSAICALFASKCIDNIRVGAKANFYILTHEAPPGPTLTEMAAAAVADVSSAEAADVSSAENGATDSLLKKPGSKKSKKPESKKSKCCKPKLPTMPKTFHFPPLMVTINEYFWCTFSMIMNISMSMLLQLVMFLKVATFSGTMQSVAVVTLSLYFVIALDTKVMESDPKLRPMYRAQVIAQTNKKTYEPKWLKTIASTAMGLMQETVPLGLLAIILFAWKNRKTGFSIGGDPFTQ